MSMDFLKSIRIAAGGMRAQAGRMRVVAENLANANSTSQTPGGDPYRRRVPTFRTSFDRELQATTVQLAVDMATGEVRFETPAGMVAAIEQARG